MHEHHYWPFDTSEIFRFELGKTTIVDGQPVRARDVEILIDGIRAKGVQRAVANHRGIHLLVRSSDPEINTVTMATNGQLHDVEVRINGLKNWYFSNVEFWEMWTDVEECSRPTKKRYWTGLNSTYGHWMINGLTVA